MSETAINCISLVERNAPRFMALRVAPGTAGVGLTREELSAVKARGFSVEFPDPNAARVETPHKRKCGPRCMAAVVNGTMAAAIKEYRRLIIPAHGEQKRIADKYGINRWTFATYLRNPKRVEQCLQFAK